MTNALSIRLIGDAASILPCGQDGRAYDAHLDDVIAVLDDACEVLAASEGVRFVVTGFTDEPWPVDVATDLAIVLEQLPQALRALRAGREFALDFYEEGIERSLHFRTNDHEVIVECVSYHTAWEPIPSKVSLDRRALELMLQELVATFLSLLHIACPRLAAHAWLHEWRQRLCLP